MFRSGLEKLTIYESALEDVPEFKAFRDFLDTFEFRKSTEGHYDDAEEKEITGVMKGKLFITKHINGRPCQSLPCVSSTQCKRLFPRSDKN